VKILDNNKKNEELLIKFTGDKQKSLRLAVYGALARLNTEMAQRTLVELYIKNKKKQDALELSEALKINLLNEFIPALLEKAKISYAKCLELDKSSDLKAIANVFENLMISINPLINNINEEITTFYKDVFTNRKHYAFLQKIDLTATFFSYKQMIESVATSLENTQEGFECLRFLTENSYYEDFLYSYFKVSVKCKMDKKAVYEYFSKHIDKLLNNNIFAEVFLDKNGKPDRNYIDDSWIRLFAEKFPQKKNISFSVARIYLGLIDMNSIEMQSFLAHVVSSYTIMNRSFNSFARLLINSGHPEAFEIIFKVTGSLYIKDYLPQNSLYIKFPREYAEKFKYFGDMLKSIGSPNAKTYYYIAKIIDDYYKNV
jgi:hypothetical protein